MKYPGLWRGYVVANDDSDLSYPHRGRVKINVPQIYGANALEDALPWAWPCLPLFGGGPSTVENEDSDDDIYSQTLFGIPPVGASVWIMFEQGDIQSPIYLGTWMGNDIDIPTEIESFRDGKRTAEYPQIFILKTPWNQTAYFRIAGDKQLDIGFQDMYIKLKGETEEGADDREIEISSITADINMTTTNGKITLSAKEMAILTENDMDIQAGRWKTEEDDSKVVDTIGDLTMRCTKDMTIHSEHKGIIQAGEDGGWFLYCENASGFDQHGEAVV